VNGPMFVLRGSAYYPPLETWRFLAGYNYYYYNLLGFSWLFTFAPCFKS